MTSSSGAAPAGGNSSGQGHREDGSVSAAYDAWHQSVTDTAADDLVAPWHQAVSPYVGLVSGRQVLEIGCGRGSFARHLSSRHPSLLVACDYSPAAVLIARERTDEPAFVVADIQRLPFRPGVFDVVISLETIEHVPNPRLAVAELSRGLKRGGTLLLTTPNYLSIMGLFRAYKRIMGDPFTEVGQPINKFLMAPLTARWVRRTGLKVIETVTYHHYLPVPGRAPVRARWLDRVPVIGKGAGLHSFVRAVR